MAKVYKIQVTNNGGVFGRGGREPSISTSEGTVAELVKQHSYTLECGASWAHEEGNSKINRNPKTAKSLVNMLNKAVNNSAANGYDGRNYELV